MSDSKYLAIDYGSKRIGIAVSDPSKIISFPRGYILNDSNTLKNILSIIKDDVVSKIIIGLPSEKYGFDVDVKDFFSKLKSFLVSKNIMISIELYDERFTSKIAEHNMRESVTKKKNRKIKGNIDSLAAQVLLQNFLDMEKNLK